MNVSANFDSIMVSLTDAHNARVDAALQAVAAGNDDGARDHDNRAKELRAWLAFVESDPRVADFLTERGCSVGTLDRMAVYAQRKARMVVACILRNVALPADNAGDAGYLRAAIGAFLEDPAGTSKGHVTRWLSMTGKAASTYSAQRPQVLAVLVAFGILRESGRIGSLKTYAYTDANSEQTMRNLIA